MAARYKISRREILFRAEGAARPSPRLRRELRLAILSGEGALLADARGPGRSPAHESNNSVFAPRPAAAS